MKGKKYKNIEKMRFNTSSNRVDLYILNTKVTKC